MLAFTENENIFIIGKARKNFAEITEFGEM